MMRVADLYDVRVPADPEWSEVIGIQQGRSVHLSHHRSSAPVPNHRCTLNVFTRFYVL